MRAVALLWTFAASLALAAQTSGPAAKAAPAAAAQIPSGATKVDAGTWTWRDAQGTEWTFRQTPFGISRYRTADANRPAPAPQKPDTQVTDLGSAWRFERQTPFGPQIWEKKKTAELNEQERALVGTIPAAAPAPAAAQGK
jgi:hypothetical protein